MMYHVATIEMPDGWQPDRFDGVPPDVTGPLDVISECEELFPAVRQAIEHNQQAGSERGGRWAVVIQPGGVGHALPGARLCTPITYQVMPIWWPDGWEPDSPLDVPNCVRRIRDRADQHELTYRQAVATVNGLNRQCMGRPGTTWYVVAAVENEPISRTVAPDRAVDVRPVHVIRGEQGGRGDCSHCPARGLPCADAEWTSQQEVLASPQGRFHDGSAR